MLGIWNFREMPSRANVVDAAAGDVWPAKRTRPAVGRTVPVNMLKSVLFPAPFGPTMQVIPRRPRPG